MSERFRSVRVRQVVLISEESTVSVRIQVLFYSMYGHIYRMSEAVVEGAREVEGAEVSLYQVAELVPEEALEKIGAKAARSAFGHVPIAAPGQLAEADAIIFGTPTRFGCVFDISKHSRRSTTGTTLPRRLMTPLMKSGVRGIFVMVVKSSTSRTLETSMANTSSANLNVRYCRVSVISVTLIVSFLSHPEVAARA